MAKLLSTRISATALASLSIVFAIGASAAPLFRWKDNQGNPVFSDRAPTPNQPFVIIGHSSRSSTDHNQQYQRSLQNLQPASLGTIGSDAEQQSLGEACDQARTTQEALSAGGR
ncbi:MAG: DUF4124 domain-containing protein, partial [Luminiphilus sp.]|nr:DUF4124 domain-containing protein [Luminiphilus sp.]